MARTVLGRGLSALIPNKNVDETSMLRVSIEQISPNPDQPRNFSEDNEFKDLVGSIKQHGILQPLVVRQKSKGTEATESSYEIIAGERRFRAACEAGLKELSVVVKQVKDDNEVFELALIENIQRQDLSPLEEAKSYKYLLDDCNISQEELARRLGKSRSYIANFVRLLNLDETVQRLIDEGKLSSSHARTLATLEPGEQRALAEEVVNQNMSVRNLEEKVQYGPGQTQKKTPNDDFRELENEIGWTIEAKVKIKSKNKCGKIEIYFSDKDELNKIKAKLLN